MNLIDLFSSSFCPRLVPEYRWFLFFADLDIALSYFVIGVAFIVYSIRRRDLFKRYVFGCVVLGGFIFLCGGTHLLSDIVSYMKGGESFLSWYVNVTLATALVSNVFILCLSQVRLMVGSLDTIDRQQGELVSKDAHIAELVRRIDQLETSNLEYRESTVRAIDNFEQRLRGKLDAIQDVQVRIQAQQEKFSNG